MTAVAFVAHHERDHAGVVATRAIEWLRSHGHDAWLVADDAAVLGLDELAGERSAASADALVAIGGDGTMLRSVGLLEGAPVAVLGVNMGALGYLTEIEAHELDAVLPRLVAGPEAGAWRLDHRMLLSITVSGSLSGTWRALNEVVVEKHEAGHTIRLLARIAGEPFTSYAADGLIVATPTGSTAYALSARGPVVSPQHRALLLTPVSPHMLFDRTLVLDPREDVEIELAGFRVGELAIDGRVLGTLAPGDVVHCRAAEQTAAFVRVRPHHFHQILKAKFGLADR